MKYQMIYQHIGITNEIKITIIHQTHNFIQSYVISGI